MARINQPPKKVPEEEFNQARARQHAARAEMARARSMARAESAERAKALARAKAEARMRRIHGEGAMGLPEDAVTEPATSTAEAQEPLADISDAPAAEKPAVETPAEAAIPKDEPEDDVPAVERPRDPDELEFALEIHDLYKSYGKKQVLKGLNLNVYPGELFGFIGRNGIGKSTTIDCMIGAKRFNSGSITVGGYDIRRDTVDAKFSYGYVASEPTCYEVMTGYDYLEFVASIYMLNETEFSKNYKYLCTRLQLNLEELAHPISGYSHGMKQKLCLAASLLHNPNIWILDEPTVGLDIMAQEELKKMMREYANHGKTVFVTSHNIELVSAICDRVAIINDGVVKAIYDLKREPEKRAQLPQLFLEIYGG